MKKILTAVAMMLVGFSMQAQQAPNKLKIYQNTGTVLELSYGVELKGLTLDEVAQVMRIPTEEEQNQRASDLKKSVIEMFIISVLYIFT